MKCQHILSSGGRFVFLLVLTLSLSCAQTKSNNFTNTADTNEGEDIKMDTATFAAGCFWCVEVQFKQLDGVTAVISGYTGGTVINPSYQQVTSGSSGHAV